MKKFILLFIAFVLLTTAFSQTAGNINLKKGQKYSVENKITAVTTQTLMGQSMESNAEITTKYSIEVKDIKENNYNLSSTFTKMKAEVSAMGSDVNFDSDNKEDMSGQYGSTFKGIINQPKDVIIDKSGKILNSITGIKPDSAQPDIMKMMVEQLIGEPGETGNGVTLAFVSIPSKISVGYSWKDSSGSEGIKRTTTYTVKEIKDNEAVITITGVINTDAKSQFQGMDIVNKSKGNLSGDQVVDLNTGIIKERTTTLESKGTISVQSQGFEIPMTSKIKFTSSVKPA